MYAALCDCLIATDCDSPFWDSYVRPGGRRVFAREREAEMELRYAMVKETMPGGHCVSDEKVRAIEIAVVACRNLVPITRHRSVPAISGPHALTQSQIAEIASWKLWPRIGMDLTESEETSGGA
jgi:hypothetical protein